jgi:hypothetical protein
MAEAVQREGKRHDQRDQGHVQRHDPVRQCIFRNGKDRYEVADSEDHPGERTVVVRLSPHKNDGRNGRANIGDDGDVERVLREMQIPPQEDPHGERDNAKEQTESFRAAGLFPSAALPEAQDGDQDGIHEAKDGRPGICFRSGATVREQDREADEGPKRPGRRDGMNFAFVCANRVRDDAQEDERAGPRAYGLGAQILFGDGGRQNAFFGSQIKRGVIVKGETKRLAGAVQGLFDQDGELLSANGALDGDGLRGPGSGPNGLALGVFFERAQDRFFVVFRFRFGHVASLVFSLVLLFGAGGAILFALRGRFSLADFLCVMLEGQADDVSEPFLFPAGHFCQSLEDPLLDPDSFARLEPDAFALADANSLALLGHGRA